MTNKTIAGLHGTSFAVLNLLSVVYTTTNSNTVAQTAVNMLEINEYLLQHGAREYIADATRHRPIKGKTRRHLQNLKYTMYSTIVREQPSHSPG